jgi:hypothetical protein
MIDTLLEYPSKGFLTQARSAFVGAPVVVVVNGRWRRWMLKKVIAGWPTSESEAIHRNVHWLTGIASVLLFSLFHAHIAGITAGYRMHFSVSGDDLNLVYAR